MQITAITDQLGAALAAFSSASRLYALSIDGDDANLMVEAFLADDMLQGTGQRDIIALSTNAQLQLAPLLGRQAALEVSLADGSRIQFLGEVTQAAMLGSEGGFARYRLRLTPWLWRLSQVRNSRVWQDKTVTAIVDEVFDAYAPLAQWRWSEETEPFMADAMARSYCCQYRESDLDFVQRLLTEEGLAWRLEQLEDGVGVVVFADSSQQSATPEDVSSKAEGSIRFHGVRAGEASDTVQALQKRRSVTSSLTTLLSYDYKAKQAVNASALSHLKSGKLPPLESYDVPGQYAYTNSAQALRYADIQMQGREAASQLYRGRSTVRTMVAGTRFSLTQGPLSATPDAAPS